MGPYQASPPAPPCIIPRLSTVDRDAGHRHDGGACHLT
jgi:hypothetical protein